MNRLVMVAVASLLLAATACAQGYEEETVVSSGSRIQAGLRGGLSLSSMSGGLWGLTEWIGEQLPNEPGFQVTGGFKDGGVSGFVFCGFVCYRVTESFSFQPEVLYVKKGVESHGTATWTMDQRSVTHEITEKLDLTYLEIPVLGKFTIPTRGRIRPSLFAGPAIAIGLSGKDDLSDVVTIVDSSTVDTICISGKPEISNMKSIELGLVTGGDVSISLGPASLVLDVRYTIGLNRQFGATDLNDVPFWDGPNAPAEYPVVVLDRIAGHARSVPDMKNRVLSITAGVTFNL